MAWDNTLPADNRRWDLAAGDIRDNNDALEVVLGVGLDTSTVTFSVDSLSTNNITSKLPIVDVTHPDFGAVGDNSTDNTTAITAALAYIKTIGAGTLFFPSKNAGTDAQAIYRFAGLLELTVTPNLTIEATGAILRNSENKGGFHFDDSDNFMWNGGTLDYVTLPTVQNNIDQHPIYITSSDNVTVQNVTITGSPFMGMAFASCQYTSIRNNKVQNTLRDGIHHVHCNYVDVSHNTIMETGDDAIACHDYGLVASRKHHVTITNNTIDIALQGIHVIGMKYAKVQDNNVSNTVLAGIITTTNDAFSAGGVAEATDVIITGNNVTEVGGTQTINGNVTTNSGTASTGRAAIMATSLSSSGLLVGTRALNNITISNNIVDASYIAGLYVADVINFVGLGNTFYNCNADDHANTGTIVEVNAATHGVNTVFSGNEVIDDRSTKLHKIGLNITTTGVATENYIVGFTSEKIFNGSVVADYRLKNHTWDPVSLPSGSGESSVSVSIPGVAFGDFVSVSAPYELEGVTVTGYVFSAGNVRIRVQNGSAATVDLVSGTWKIRVIRE